MLDSYPDIYAELRHLCPKSLSGIAAWADDEVRKEPSTYW